VAELAVGRSGLGDGLVAFRQGPFGNAAIVAAQVTAPPAPFVVNVPKKWIKPSGARISWLAATSADGPLVYRVVLDGHVRPAPAGALAATVDPRGLGSGKHRLQILAIDANGQSTLSAPAPLLIDGTLPTVRFGHPGGHTISVSVSDPNSGVVVRAVRIGWGDGASSSGRARSSHRYSASGVFQITVSVRDKVGNAGIVRRLVSVR
jgi:hypothetical protein